MKKYKVSIGIEVLKVYETIIEAESEEEAEEVAYSYEANPDDFVDEIETDNININVELEEVTNANSI